MSTIIEIMPWKDMRILSIRILSKCLLRISCQDYHVFWVMKSNNSCHLYVTPQTSIYELYSMPRLEKSWVMITAIIITPKSLNILPNPPPSIPPLTYIHEICNDLLFDKQLFIVIHWIIFASLPVMNLKT